MARPTACPCRRAATRSGSGPGMPGKAGGPVLALIARAKASSTAGLMAVSPGRGHGIGGRTGQALVEVPRDAPVSGAREQGLGEARLLIGLQQGGGQPGGAVPVQELAHLALVGGPVHVARRRPRPVVGDHETRSVRPEKLGVPEAASRCVQDRRGCSIANSWGDSVTHCGMAARRARHWPGRVPGTPSPSGRRSRVQTRAAPPTGD